MTSCPQSSRFSLLNHYLHMLAGPCKQRFTTNTVSHLAPWVERAGLPSDQIYQSDQSIQIRYEISSDQSIQTQASVHLIYLNGAATLEPPDHLYVPAPERVALPEKLRCYRGQPS
jgi:hypothetical protein